MRTKGRDVDRLSQRALCPRERGFNSPAPYKEKQGTVAKVVSRRVPDTHEIEVRLLVVLLKERKSNAL